MSTKLTQADFIDRFKKKFGNSYDLSQTVYVHARENVEIVCGEHGAFRATPDALLGKNRRPVACPKCSQKQRSELQKDDEKSFLKKAKQKHGNSYRYPDLIYVDTRTPVKVQCPRHGTFERMPNVFLYGRGCPKCAMEKRHESRRLSKDEIKARVTKIHGDNITVALEGYLNKRQIFDANCKTHGKFSVKIADLLSGRGCPTCGRKKAADARRLTTKTWVQKAKDVHGNRYDYSKVRYETAHKLVDIICKTHGLFKCRPTNHVSLARGCPHCAKTGPKKSCAGTSAKARVSRSEFEARLEEAHPNNQFLLDKVAFKNMHTKILVGCPIHGYFSITPANLIRGAGCKSFSYQTISEKRRLPVPVFINRCEKQYIKKYDYSLIQFSNLH